MERYLAAAIKRDLKRKMVILTGPRQVGKTYLARELMSEFKRPQYLNYDDFADARLIRAQGWPLDADLVIFDEIHKMKGWKRFVKGVYDTRPARQSVMVTGSARLEALRQAGESLAGRYFHFRLNPVSVRELRGNETPYEALNLINRLGGFPEPFLSGSETEAARWRNQYYTDLVREDILEFSRIHEVKTIRLLLEMLRERAGSPLSYRSLAGDLQLAPNTVRRYVEILESLCIIFLIRPYHANVARAVLREPKVYFYDSGYVRGDEGLKLENSCAVCILKHVHFLQDTAGEEISLNYIRTRDGREIDFAIVKAKKPSQLLEVKLADDHPSPALRHFSAMFPGTPACQLVHHLRREQHAAGIDIRNASGWLAELSA